MNEFDFIESLRELSGSSEIGDDAVLLGDSVLCKDIMVEGVHFTRDMPLELVIHKLFSSNMSDIAACGASPEFVLLGLSMPREMLSFEVAEAISRNCTKYGVKLVGGDTTTSDKIFLSLSVIGTKVGKFLSRSGAAVGDIVILSRPVGLSKISLETNISGRVSNIDKFMHLKMEAEINLGKYLSLSDDVTSCTDISDGLGLDLFSISKSSGVKIVIVEDMLPLISDFDCSLHDMLSSGEEYALVFTVKDGSSDFLMDNVEKDLNHKLYPIGWTEKPDNSEAGVYLLSKNRQLKDISSYGYTH